MITNLFNTNRKTFKQFIGVISDFNEIINYIFAFCLFYKSYLVVLILHLFLPTLQAMDSESSEKLHQNTRSFSFFVSEKQEPQKLTPTLEDTLYQIGEMYYKRTHYSEAVHWYFLAAAQSHVDALYSIGFMYDQGLGVPKDIYFAIDIYVDTAMQGHSLAQWNLKNIFKYGEECEKSYIHSLLCQDLPLSLTNLFVTEDFDQII